MREIDFTDVGEPEEWTPAPPGDYILQLMEVEETTVQSGDNIGAPRDNLKFEIVDCEGELEKYNGRTIYFNAMYSAKSLPIVKKMLQAFGAEVPEGPMKFDWEELIGLKLQANLKSTPARKDNKTGKDYSARNEIRRFIVPDEKE